MGAVRLAIIDLNQRSDQPFYSEDGNYTIVYNGEIYNYLELRDELEKLGHVFNTSCDTEVLLYSYVEWGKYCLDKLNGMFAFVIYNKRMKTLFVARDRFGIKPIYILQSGNKIAFASEIKQFSTLDNFSRKINLDRSIDFISWRIFNHTNETMFSDVYQLRGGQYLDYNLIDGGSIPDEIKTWYSYKKLQSNDDNNVSERENFRIFRNLLTDSISLRLRSDVEIATALSGGIDSSSLSCIIDNLHDNGQSTFTVRNYDPKIDEFEYASSVISKIKVNHKYEIFLDQKDFFEDMGKMIWFNDEPIASYSMVAQGNLFNKIFNENFKVALNGQGGDELLGIYGLYKPYLNELFKKRAYLNWIRECFSVGWSKVAVTRYIFYQLSQFLTPRKECFYHNDAFDIFSRDYSCTSYNTHNKLAKAMNLDIVNSLRDYNIFILMFSSLPMLLQYDDRTSMRYSVESRVPFLDYRLVEFVMALPSNQKIKKGVNKYLLKESLKEILPRKIYNRSTKLGYATPQHKWLMGELRTELVERINDLCSRFDLFDYQKLERLCDRIDDPKAASLLMRILSFDIWTRKFSLTS